MLARAISQSRSALRLRRRAGRMASAMGVEMSTDFMREPWLVPVDPDDEVVLNDRRIGFVALLDKFADYCAAADLKVDAAVVAVCEKYARDKLGIDKGEPLIYRGMALRCVGSKVWRDNRDPETLENRS